MSFFIAVVATFLSSYFFSMGAGAILLLIKPDSKNDSFLFAVGSAVFCITAYVMSLILRRFEVSILLIFPALLGVAMVCVVYTIVPFMDDGLCLRSIVMAITSLLCIGMVVWFIVFLIRAMFNMY